MSLWINLLTGILFGVGLVVAQLVNPERIIGFLDVTGQWDPSLLLTMLGALPVTWLGYQCLFHYSKKPWCAKSYTLPQTHSIDRPLVVGAAIFGIGWGWVGYCPGPIIAALSVTLYEPLWVLLGFLVGSYLGYGVKPLLMAETQK